MISDSVRVVLVYSGRKQVELADYFGVTRGGMNNKILQDRWFAKDLVRVAEFVGARLCFEMPDGRKVYIDDKVKG